MHLFIARFVSDADRIRKDDVLTRIDALMRWRWCSPTCKRAFGCSVIAPCGLGNNAGAG
ncbi:MAG: hypothetical protein GDA36_09340 [Rhodobacteraceae bacterium]|nr:hypothetical protein [Paracoccaceae bacterium]